MTYALRAPCRWCSGSAGELRPTNGQNCVYCASCGRLAYNAPKTETGEAVRSLSDRPDIKPGQRARLMERALYRCEPCGASAPRVLVIAHFLSVKDGRDLGVADDLLFSDENLYVSCELCNSGQGAMTVSPRLALAILRARLAQSRRTTR